MSAPLGRYDDDKILNIGTNRWSFKPELGVSKALGPLTLELASGVTFYTDNTDFFGGRTQEQDPLYSLQGHVIYQFPRGFWGSLDATYYAGGRTTVNGVENDDRQENVRLGLTLAIPLDRHFSIKFYASTGVYSRTSNDFTAVGTALQYRWGGGY